MIYVDTYDSKAITNAPPSKSVPIPGDSSEALKYFWYAIGVTIAENYNTVKNLIAKQGLIVDDKADAVKAITDMWGTKKWDPFLKDITPVVADTLETKHPELLPEESPSGGWVTAVIQAVGSIGTGVAGAVSSDKQLQASKAQAQATALQGIAGVVAEKEKAKAEIAKAQSSEKRALIYVLIALIFVIGAIIAIVVYKKRQQRVISNGV